MATQDQQNQNTSSQGGNSFNKGLVKDINESYLEQGAYTHARNATKYTVLGDINTRVNEPSTKPCLTNQVPYTIIGAIHLYGDKWTIFSTDDNGNSEIGLFDDSDCSYSRIIHDPCIASITTGGVIIPCNDTTTSCLNFSTKHLIIGISKMNFDCTWQIYWADGTNPDRTLNIDKPALVQNCVDSLQHGPDFPGYPVDCITCTDTNQIDCDAIRLARLITSPCLSVTRGTNGGNLQNGSYFAVVAYVINEQRVTDYFPPSNVQSIFEHENLAGSLEISIGEMDTDHFDEFELVIVRTINQQTSAKRIGLYSTRSKHIFLDTIPETLVTIPIELIPFRSPVYEKSEAIYNVGVYALRVAPTTKFDFNYQPLANRITTKWISVEYPSDYYRKGGNVTSYLRDEVYAFFIRWVYTTGDRSSSYHIPGRAASCVPVATSATIVTDVPTIVNTFKATKTIDQIFNVTTSQILFQNDSTGGNFDNGNNYATSIYTAPINIKVKFILHLTITSTTIVGSDIVTLVLNNAIPLPTSLVISQNPGTHSYVFDTGFINLSAGDTIEVRASGIGTWTIDVGSTFENQIVETVVSPGTTSSVCDKDINTSSDAIEFELDSFNNPIPGSYHPENWQVYNTASWTPNSSYPKVQADGGVIIGEGNMAYWESTEIYPNNRPEIWNQQDPSHKITSPTAPLQDIYPVDNQWSVYTGDQPVQLCGTPIRHHKMPDNFTQTTGGGIGGTEHFYKDPITGIIKIRVIGVSFDKIRAPRDNEGNLIPGIVGYEILRGSREGNKSVIAKGIINNMRKYSLTKDSDGKVLSGKQGLYPNYPYNPVGNTPGNPHRHNLTIDLDPTISETDQSEQGGFGQILSALTAPSRPPDLNSVSDTTFTFHSPDTQFKNPFLSMKEIKLYGEYSGDVIGNFEDVPGHPKEKLLRDIAFLVAAIFGLASAGLAIRGKRTVVETQPHVESPAIPLAGALAAGIQEADNTGVAFAEFFGMTTINVLLASIGFDLSDIVRAGVNDLGGTAIALVPGGVSQQRETITELPESAYLGPILKGLTGLITFAHYWTLGTDAAMRLIESLVPYTQYAYRYRSHGFYDSFNKGNAISGNFRKRLINSNYLDNQFQDFGVNYKINNLYRGKTVAIEVNTPILYPNGIDNTIQSIGKVAFDPTLNPYVSDPVKFFHNPKGEFKTQTTVYYTALKSNIRNQYGQMTSIQEVPVTCVFSSLNLITKQQILSEQSTNSEELSPIFGGDTYITRYTEKNTFFYFYDWLLGQPDGTEFDYRLRYMINFPMFWADFTKFETGEFLSGFINALQSGTLPSITPSGKSALDRFGVGAVSTILGSTNPGGALVSIIASLFSGSNTSQPGEGFLNNLFSFRMKNAYFYLFQSGVRDFYVESEINTDLRDWGNATDERHYDPYRYTDTFALFDPKIIKSGNFFKYDFSLSISRLFLNFISWGNQQPRSYDPLVAEHCFSFYPFRILYSLPQNLENKKDYWRSYLANNYKDFNSRVTAIEPINKNGAIILFESASPIQFQGIDTLVTELNTKVTIGDGGLFSQPLQSTTNADISYEYGSCQNRLSVINTPMGLYWMSENQGKVFLMTSTMKDITLTSGLKFWFKKYLPYFLLKDFSEFELVDNPVVGIGCQAIYDNQLELVYFCKKDYKLKESYTGRITYKPSCLRSDCNPKKEAVFLIDGVEADIKLTDTTYFEDCSWTVSYDPKDESWISYHDWHPDLVIPSKNNFLSIKGNQIWRHNDRTDSFCNFYGVDYPFEIEYVTATGINVNTVRSLEYYLECYRYDVSGINKYQFLDFNFDHAIISNTEQVSGQLNLVLTPKNDPGLALTYPRINPNSIDILYSKEEQKYRFNTFFDVTDNRGEYNLSAQRVIWLNDANGYTRTLNPVNLDYQKSPFQRKKFRHYLTKVSLVRNVSDNKQMIFKTAITKLLDSRR